ncbi:uncharacterized protein LOC110462289 [Mizuhopecten yessoensis]|uniref:uncharacterized protein LOC110462289 n=1 Tax=Mizuhopecten yessoensis TaxID=6573 RepID=UPI000B45B1E8|nr:uncharacterized protein LOC110462289 [Mizuhopecten yessoensis]
MLLHIICIHLITGAWSSDNDGWVLVFKGVTGGSTSIYDLFLGNTTFNSYVVEAQILNNTFRDHYKSDIINYWDDMNITKVKVGVYVGHKQKAFLEFDAQGCDKSTWFDRTKLINSSYTDLLEPSTPINYFSMAGHVNEAGPNHHIRRFFINSLYGGCSNDYGWLIVYDGGSVGICEWEKDHNHETPAVLYSPKTTVSHFKEDRAHIKADFMTISVQFGSNSRLTPCLLPESKFCCRDNSNVTEEEKTTQGPDITTTTAQTITNTSAIEVSTFPTIDIDTLHNKVAEIKKDLAVVKKKTSAYVRSKSSAYDGRESSQNIGIFGVVILTTVTLLIVIPDMMVMFRAVYNKC